MIAEVTSTVIGASCELLREVDHRRAGQVLFKVRAGGAIFNKDIGVPLAQVPSENIDAGGRRGRDGRAADQLLRFGFQNRVFEFLHLAVDETVE